MKITLKIQMSRLNVKNQKLKPYMYLGIQVPVIKDPFQQFLGAQMEVQKLQLHIAI